MRLRSVVLPVLLLLCFHTANSWVYPEHRRIALLAIQKLSPQQRAVLDKLWAQARRGNEGRLTASVIDPEQGLHPPQIDYAAWTGISGDHSCSPNDMLDIVLKSDWILNVAHIAAQLEADIRTARNQSEHINAIRNSDIRLQRADAEYATRAGSNNVHFLMARPEVNTDGSDYFVLCHAAGAELNAIGMYSWFHTSALNKISRLREDGRTDEEKTLLALAALADEAFALHFLEDVFASGHTAGTWGVAAVRKGTHDYYNEKGLEVTTWNGERAVIKGDAYMRDEDAAFAAESVTLSLQQLIMAATGELRVRHEGDLTSLEERPDTFNVCKNNFQPRWQRRDTVNMKREVLTYLPQVLRATPVPGLANGVGELPRFRAELGMFYGVSSSINGRYAFGGFAEGQTNQGFIGGLGAGLRFGLGLDGVLNEAGDGLVFVQAGIRQDASSSHNFLGDPNATPVGALTSAIPGRAGWDFRMRLPFWLLPGDLLVVGPILYLISPQKAQEMGVIAVNGGLVPWQTGWQTGIGRFQVILGREVGLSLYGTSTFGNDALFVPSPNGIQVISYSSTKWDFPFLEYRPTRSFSLNQASSLLVQFSAGVDLPYNTQLLEPVGEPQVKLSPVWYLGARIIFDWRKYF
ncbi:MAG: hypothetical protein JNN04_08830 [Cyclobacteriaceae bacterium]|nr:hypothetical protein [Cyclobacteriaceae bacterium]